MEQLTSLFPDLSMDQLNKFGQLKALYEEWNAQINVISRKDIDQFNERHLLHSLAIGLFTTFKSEARVLDVGTGGGFPGIPLAILYPECEFLLIDSIGKKIKVVNDVAEQLGLDNVKAQHIRAENVDGQFDYVVSRAVTRLERFYGWIENKIDFSRFANSGLYALKGGDLNEEIQEFEKSYKQLQVNRFYLSKYLKDEFFETKQLLHIN